MLPLIRQECIMEDDMKTFFYCIILVLFAVLLTRIMIKQTCASEDAQCSPAPVLPIPTVDYVASVSPTCTPVPFKSPTIASEVSNTPIPAIISSQPTEIPSAGSSASVVIPSGAPDTGRGNN